MPLSKEQKISQNIVSRRIQNEFLPLTSWIALMGCIASIFCTILFIINKVGLFFILFNSIIGVILLFLVIFRNKFDIFFKTVAVTAIIIIHSCITLYKSGLIGTGIMTLLLAQIFVLVFLNLRYAIIISSGTILIVGVYGILVHLDIIQYQQILFIRMTMLSQWIIIIIGSLVFLGVSSLIITYLKKRLINNIIDLEDANTQLEASKNSLEHIAYYDILTGLPNRFKLHEEIQKRINSGIKSGHLVLINIRGFRLINSLYGSEQGDKILGFAAQIISKYLDDINFIARLNSDEFASWTETDSREKLNNKIKDLKKHFNRNIPENYQGSRIEFYSSVASYPEDGSNYLECFHKASIALKFARESDSDKIFWFKQSMIEKLDLELKMRALLEKAIQNNSFTLDYQSKYNINTKKVVGVEALARWNSEELGNVSPNDFIPVLSKYQLMILFTKVVFKKVLSEIPLLKNKFGNHVHVSINISPTFFFWPGFEDFIISNIKEANIESSMITLEITEDIFIEKTEHISLIISKLKKAGIHISLDDFGKGFSSLYYISHIDIDELKIDKSFIDDICHDEKSFTLLKSICNIASSLGCEVVAEGVENIDQINKIKLTECKIVQGYYYSKPEPV